MELLIESALQSIIVLHSATLAGYIWTSLALFAAALSLWRLRFLGSGSASESPAPVPAAAVPSAPAIVTVDCSDRMECESSTKGRFTAYFFEDEEMDGGDEGEEWMSDGFGSGMDGLDCLDWGWKGDLGWYGYQDRTAINGCVVRLWESGRRGFAAAVREGWI